MNIFASLLLFILTCLLSIQVKSNELTACKKEMETIKNDLQTLIETIQNDALIYHLCTNFANNNFKSCDNCKHILDSCNKIEQNSASNIPETELNYIYNEELWQKGFMHNRFIELFNDTETDIDNEDRKKGKNLTTQYRNKLLECENEEMSLDLQKKREKYNNANNDKPKKTEKTQDTSSDKIEEKEEQDNEKNKVNPGEGTKTKSLNQMSKKDLEQEFATCKQTKCSVSRIRDIKKAYAQAK